MSSSYSKTLYCSLSGVQIGVLTLTGASAGASPYIRNFDRLVTLHPIFSMETSRLLAFSRTMLRQVGEDSSDDNKQTLRILFLAVLHSLDCVQQEVPALPPMWVVQSNFKALFSLAYWKFALESKRFVFPTYKITKRNNNSDFREIKSYLDLCFDIKESYSSEVRTRDESARVEAASRAEKKLRSSWVAPLSNREMWAWIQAQLADTKYKADSEGWMATIFLSKTDKAICQFDKEELTLFDEIIQSECISDNGMMFAVRARIEEIKKIWSDNKEAFEVDFEDFDVDSELVSARKLATTETASVSLEQPKREDYPNTVSFIRANALWYLQSRKDSK